MLAAALLTAPAQTNPPLPPTNPPPPLDPLMSLMISQPKIDTAGPVAATATFDPPVVAPGALTFYRVTFNALEESIEWPTNLAAPPGLSMQPGAHGQILQMTGPQFEPRTAFNYRVRATTPGEYTLPQIQVNVYGKPVVVPMARLTVAAVPSAAAPPAPRLTLELSTTNPFVGQAVGVRVLSPGMANGVIQPLSQVQLVGPDILVDLAAGRQRIEQMTRNGLNVPTYIYETTFTPMQAGKLAVFAQGFAAGLQLSAPIVIKGPASFPAGLPQYTLLESDVADLHVRPLPPEGELAGFTGAIGALTMDLPRLATNLLRVGVPVELRATVRGQGNLARLVAPPPPEATEWQMLSAPTEIGPAPPPAGTPQIAAVIGAPQVAAPQGATTFRYTLIPLTERTRATPPIPFSYFDPERGAYADLSVPPVPVTVTPGLVPADFQALGQSRPAATLREKEPALSRLAPVPGTTAGSLIPWQERAWFPWVQLAPAAAFLGLWLWDRRRRYLEQYPDIVLRRQARRALRREVRALQKAARAGNAPQFAAVAVAALRTACAPHYHAEARALVGSDILPLLPEGDRARRPGEVVRRFFAITDACRFATVPSDATELLALQPDLERLLQQLEAKL